MQFFLGKRTFLIVPFGALLLIPIFSTETQIFNAYQFNKYHIFIANLVMLYIILSLGLNMLIGFAGQLAFANAAMYGIGAYGAGLLMMHFAWPYWAAAPGGMLIAMAAGTVLALPALRMSGIYLALTTLAFAQFVWWVMTHWTSVTFGAGGFIPPAIDFSPIPVTQEIGIYYLTWVAAILLYLVAKNTMASSIGRAFVAIRDGEVAAESLGINLFRYKALAFAISGFYAGTAGALYGGMLGFVGPESFDLLQMILHKAAVVLGGLGSIIGSVIGGVLLTISVEITKELKWSIEMAFGGLLMLLVLFQPTGLVTFIKRWVPGWREHLQYLPEREAQRTVDADETAGHGEMASTDGSAQERQP